jgi:hypothetical protein
MGFVACLGKKVEKIDLLCGVVVLLACRLPSGMTGPNDPNAMLE